MYTGVLDKNWIRKFYISIGCPIGTPSKLYEDNKETIKVVLVDRITPQSSIIVIPITDLHKLHIHNTFYILDTDDQAVVGAVRIRCREYVYGVSGRVTDGEGGGDGWERYGDILSRW